MQCTAPKRDRVSQPLCGGKLKAQADVMASLAETLPQEASFLLATAKATQHNNNNEPVHATR